LENDLTLRQHEQEGYGLHEIRRDAQEYHTRRQRKKWSKSWLMALDTREEGKKDLLQYKIFENDSDEDVFEGLGNTTLDMRGNIAAGCSSDEGSEGIDNNQMDGTMRGADKVDKKIIEIAV